MHKRYHPFATARRPWLVDLLSIGVIGLLVVLLIGGALILLWPRIATHAATHADGSGPDDQVNQDCTLVVPPHPLTAQGLATPYQLVATNPDQGPCHEKNPMQAAFVQASVFDATTGQIFVYNPLVIDQGTRPAIPPLVPKLPAHALVGIWFGFNGNNLTLRSVQQSLREGHCVNGVANSIFTQFAYCNAPQFFEQVNQAIKAGLLTPPPLGTGKDGQTCLSLRDFGLVDQDQSDNVTTGYLVTGDGRTAQLTTANRRNLPNARPLTNGSDNGLLDAFVDPALGCVPWMVSDLADPGQMTTALPLDEMQAMVNQQAPVALVPLTDPMVLNNDKPDLNKLNAYRVGVDQPRALDNAQADGKTYCQHLAETGAPRIVLDAPLTVKMTAPDPAVGNTLFTFLAQRFANSYTNLKCQQLLGKASPLVTTQNGKGVAISATFNGQPINTGMGGMPGTPVATGTPGTPGNAPDCRINGQTVKGCSGTVNVDGQSCTFSFANNAVVIVCHKKR